VDEDGHLDEEDEHDMDEEEEEDDEDDPANDEPFDDIEDDTEFTDTLKIQGVLTGEAWLTTNFLLPNEEAFTVSFISF
jgi:hypothetical protein